MNEKRMDSKKIGTAIRALRQEKRLSQQELANALFVDRTLVNKWEHGKANLTIHTLIFLSRYFEVDIRYFFTDQKSINESEVIGNKE